jgi:hypothetical protein
MVPSGKSQGVISLLYECREYRNTNFKTLGLCHSAKVNITPPNAAIPTTQILVSTFKPGLPPRKIPPFPPTPVPLSPVELAPGVEVPAKPPKLTIIPPNPTPVVAAPNPEVDTPARNPLRGMV